MKTTAVCAVVALTLSSVAPGAQYEPPTFLQYYEPVGIDVEPSAPGYGLPLDVGSIVNFGEVAAALGLGDIETNIEHDGFVVVEHDFGFFDPNRDDIVQPYRYLAGREVPLFVTSDTWLHLYHVQFDETLREIEEREFVEDLEMMTSSMRIAMRNLYDRSDGELKEAAWRNIAFLSVAQKLLMPHWSVPPMVVETVDSELARIEAHQGFAASDIFIYEEDYSQYVPRGHYTRSDALKRYFKAMMWYGRMGFLLKGSDPWCPMCKALISPQDARIQTLQGVLLAQALYSEVGSQTALDLWDRIYTVTAFYVGLADDLTPYDYMWAAEEVLGADWMSRLEALTDDATYFELKSQLALLPSPRIYGGTGNIMVVEPITEETLDDVLNETTGMRLMGQRFIPDSYLFQRLVFPSVTGYKGHGPVVPFTYGYDGMGFSRCYPRGLDVMALLGSDEALKILIDEGDTDYWHFWERFGLLKDEFDAFGEADWNQNLYWSWLHALAALAEELPPGYPRFMRTDTWQRHQLHSALASWAQLRHDTILYAKQSYTPRFGAVPTPPPPPPPGYVEPLPQFLGRLLALNKMTRVGLADLDVLSPEATQRLLTLEALIGSALDITVKHLANEPLSQSDNQFIKDLPSRLEGAVTTAANAGVKTTLVADVHTHVTEEQVVEEATGRVDLIVVACPAPDGSVFLAVGPVLSYYEFKHRMDDRLTDEAWREMLDGPDRPDRPLWYAPLMGPEVSITQNRRGAPL